MKTGFIGAGKMAEAIVASLVTSKTLDAGDLWVSDVSPDRREWVKSRYGVNVCEENRRVAEATEVLFLCVKPQDLDGRLSELAASVTARHLVISIAAGKRMETIETRLPAARVVRVMPNLACLVGEAMSVYCPGTNVTRDDRALVERLLSACGRVLELPEDQFDAVTALSGSGPAFLCYFLKGMIDAGVAQGLLRDHAVLLAEQTMLGTARLLMEKGMDPETLIRDVTSARGTTAAGLDVLAASDVTPVIGETIRAAAVRSRALSC